MEHSLACKLAEQIADMPGLIFCPVCNDGYYYLYQLNKTERFLVCSKASCGFEVWLTVQGPHKETSGDEDAV